MCFIFLHCVEFMKIIFQSTKNINYYHSPEQIDAYIQREIIKRVARSINEKIELPIGSIAETQPIGLMNRVKNESILREVSPNPIYNHKQPMCNTKNTELIRQQLWCDVVKSNNGELTFDKILAEADKVVAEFDKRFNDKLRYKDDALFDFRTKTSLINLERKKHGLNPIETLNTDREPPIINTSLAVDEFERLKKEKLPLRDTTTYIERGLSPREVVRTESTQVKPVSPKDRVIKEIGLLYEIKQFFGFKNNQDSFE